MFSILFSSLHFLGLVSPAHAIKLAVIDSGTDITHPVFQNKVWFNPLERKGNNIDDDVNGKTDDINGWNFALDSNVIFENSQIARFQNPDFLKYFDLQKKQLNNNLTPSDLAWLKSKSEDKTFLASLDKFGEFVHGTHVSGIAVSLAEKPELITMSTHKVEVQSLITQFKFKNKNILDKIKLSSSKENFEDDPKKIFYQLLEMFATEASTGLLPIGEYVNVTGARVANGSFGTGPEIGVSIVSQSFESLFGQKPTVNILKASVKYFLKTLTSLTKPFVSQAPNTLFVFAAGNDAEDNDIYPTSPSSLSTANSNVISVAATFDNNELAPFSSYGQKSVDIAAPGVAIISSIPANQNMALSGTSQASPRVAAAALAVFEVLPKATPRMVKSILMKTVDEVSSLKLKVKSAGVLNAKRALAVATLMRDQRLSLNDALLEVKTKESETAEPPALAMRERRNGEGQNNYLAQTYSQQNMGKKIKPVRLGSMFKL